MSTSDDGVLHIGHAGAKTGFVSTPENIEEVYTALHNGKCCVVEAPAPGVGRSELLLEVAVKLEQDGVKCCIVCMKNGDGVETIQQRMIDLEYKKPTVLIHPEREDLDDVDVVLIDDADYILGGQMDIFSENRLWVVTTHERLVDMERHVHSGRLTKSANKA